MSPEEARRRLDEYLAEAHGLCGHDVVLTLIKCSWQRRLPCAWPQCDHPVHEHDFCRMKMRHAIHWPEGLDVWLALIEEQTRRLAGVG